MAKLIARISVSLILGFAIAWFFSALIHTTDSDIGGIQGLMSPGMLGSVTFYAVGTFMLIMIVQLLYISSGWGGLIPACLGVSFIVALFLTLLGSSATTLLGKAWGSLQLCCYAVCPNS